MCFIISLFSVAVFEVEGVFAGMQQSTVQLAVPGAQCQHNVTVNGRLQT